MRILFVDDDQKLLRSLRRMLMARSGEWEMRFVSGGREALDLLEGWETDIVVADMRMPGMDGAQFLAAVQERYPGVIRIVLSGHSERDYIMQAVRPAHQFLSKPCSEQDLLDAVERAFGLRSLIADRRIIDAVTRLDFLPALPAALDRLLGELGRETCSLADVGDVVAADVGLSANILKLVNSSFFGLKRVGRTPAQAVAYLGLDVLRGLVLRNGFFAPLDGPASRGMSFERLWGHSLTTAGFARGIAREEGAGEDVADRCCVAGLLHDVGKLVLALCLDEEYPDVLGLAERRNIPVADAEAQMLGTTHAQVGGYLLGLWGFDPDVVGSVAGHAAPSDAASRPGILAYVHAANALEHELVRINDQYAPHPPDHGYLAERGLAGRTDAWRTVCRGLLAEKEGA